MKTVENLALHKFWGIRILEDGQDLKIVVSANPNTLNNVGVVHGGVISTLLDVSSYLSVLPLLGDDENAVTHDLHVSIMRPVKANEEIIFQGRVLKRGKINVFAESKGEVENRLVAVARVTKTILKSAS